VVILKFNTKEEELKKISILICLFAFLFSNCSFNKNPELESKIENQEAKVNKLEQELASLKEYYDFQLKNQTERIEKLRQFLSLMNSQEKENPVVRFVSPFIPDKVEFCGEEVPLEKFEVRERLERALFREANRWGMCLIFLRSGRWFPLIEENIKKQNLPKDLKYVAAIESDLNTEAYSYAGAAGLWQFIKDTATDLCGLTIDSYVDERLDPEKSTEAALKHFKELYQEFGDWMSALAGYNMHKDRYRREKIKEHAVNFYDIKDIPLEALQYPFRAIAVKLIMENPEKYGFPSWEEIGKAKYDPYPVKPITLVVRKTKEKIVEIAERFGMTYYQFRVFNPHILIKKNKYKVVTRDYLHLGKYKIYITKKDTKKDVA